MSIIIDNEYPFDFDVYELSELLLEKVLQEEGLETEAEVNITIADDPEILKINKEFRGIDKVTDVLSFPAVPFQIAGDPDGADLEDDEYYNPDTGELILGDMILSYDRLTAQAKEYGHSIKREYAFLVVHSLLHLLGYDHEDEKDEIIMREKQTGILNDLGISR